MPVRTAEDVPGLGFDRRHDPGQISVERLDCDSDASDEAKYEQFKSEVLTYVRRAVPESEMAPLEHVGPLEFNWRGLVRYWKKKGV